MGAESSGGLNGIRQMRVDPAPVVHSDPEILGGIPVFVGTRVPVQNLIDHLDAGDSVEDFLRSFPTVDRELVIAYLDRADG